MGRKFVQPPFLARILLALMRDYVEDHSSTGDLLEEFREFSQKKGKLVATLWYWGQVFLLFIFTSLNPSNRA